MTETRIDKGFAKNPTTSDSEREARRIQGVESDAFVARVKEIIGDRKLTWFASECGVGESTLRNILAGAWPRTDILCAIADAGRVSIDWLATGRLPKVREPRRAVQAQAQAQSPNVEVQPFDGRRDMLEAVLRVMEHRITNNQVDQTVIDAGLKGAPAWLEAARDYPDLQVRLRSAIATLEFMSAAGLD